MKGPVLAPAKTCSRCKAVGGEFYRNRRAADGLDHRCAACAREVGTSTNKAMAALRDRHYDEFIKLREMAKAGLL